MELTLSEFYKLLSGIFIILIIIFALLFIFVKFKFNLKFFKKLAEPSERGQKITVIIFLLLFLASILCFGILQFMIYDLDKSTTVVVDEKIVIIELDDYWNFGDAGLYYESYGYTFERYRSVSEIIDKHDFVATLGITPYIFIEDTQENFPLKQDIEMIDYLKELEVRGYELGMHGYNHCRNEYYCPRYEEVWYNVLKGKRELEEIFRKELVSYFPPGNEWTTEQYENVKKAGFLLIGNTHVPKAYFDENIIITQKGYDPIYVYSWYGKDFRHTSVDEWIDEYNKKNLFILQLHANTFDSQSKLDDLDTFLDYVKNDGARVMTYREFYNYIKEERKAEGKDLSGHALLDTD